MIMKRIKIYKNSLIFKMFFREHSSKEWLFRQKTDPYVEKAKINSYRYLNIIVCFYRTVYIIQNYICLLLYY